MGVTLCRPILRDASGAMRRRRNHQKRTRTHAYRAFAFLYRAAAFTPADPEHVCQRMLHGRIVRMRRLIRWLFGCSICATRASLAC